MSLRRLVPTRRASILRAATLAALLPLAAIAAPASAPTAAAARLHELLDADWQWQMQDTPEYATSLGDRRYDDRLSDESPAAVERREAHARELLAGLEAIDRPALAGEDAISCDFALYEARLAVDYQRYPVLHTRVLSALDGPQIALPQLLHDTPIRSEREARDALARLKAIPRLIAQDIAWLREGKRLGWVTFRASLEQVPGEIDGLFATPVERNPLFDPFNHLPGAMPEASRRALQAEAAAALRGQVRPAYLELRRVVIDELLPASPAAGGLVGYPDGPAIYKLMMRDQTTLGLDARTVHELGLSEIARIHGRIAEVMREVGFQGSYPEFVAYVNHDPKFFFTKADDLLAAYRDIAKRVDPQLPKLFLRLPRTPYGIRPIPAYQGTNVSEFYTPSAADGSSPGWFNANVVALAQRPKWEMEATFLHEGVPGHHLQISRAQELTQLPMFRRNASPNAYVEGWALYSEGLGAEVGLYTDPYSRYGQLRMEAFRAARLVIDTGLHALGWTRDQAIAYMVDNAGIAREDAQAEIDRYTVWPGQALGYKLGQLKLLALRDKAKAALGERFDLRAFHQELLDHGPLPLPVLERVIDDWIARGGPSPLTASATAPDAG